MAILAIMAILLMTRLPTVTKRSAPVTGLHELQSSIPVAACLCVPHRVSANLAGPLAFSFPIFSWASFCGPRAAHYSFRAGDLCHPHHRGPPGNRISLYLLRSDPSTRD